MGVWWNRRLTRSAFQRAISAGTKALLRELTGDTRRLYGPDASRQQSKYLVDELGLASNCGLAQYVVTAVDHTQHLETLDGSVGGPHRMESTNPPYQLLQRAMLGLNRVVGGSRCRCRTPCDPT